ncbi:MAG: Flp family type IVb pilin [Actinomycetota bacterium]
MKAPISHFAQDESGATAVEYGLLVAGLSVAILLTVQALGATITGIFETLSNEIGGK